jgi:hypothetical protein
MRKYNYNINATLPLKLNYNQQTNIQSMAPIVKKDSEALKFAENLDILLAQEQKQLTSKLLSLNENSLSQFQSNTNVTNTPSKLHMLTEVNFNNKLTSFYIQFNSICIN